MSDKLVADKRGRFFSDSQYTYTDAGFGTSRGFGRLWAEDSVVETPEDPAGWERGSIVRRSQPIFVLTSLGPSLDKAGPAAWRPNL